MWGYFEFKGNADKEVFTIDDVAVERRATTIYIFRKLNYC